MFPDTMYPFGVPSPAMDDREESRRLRELTTTARKARDWTTRRDQLVAQAVADGLGVRQVARAVELSHAGVRRIIERTPL